MQQIIEDARCHSYCEIERLAENSRGMGVQPVLPANLRFEILKREGLTSQEEKTATKNGTRTNYSHIINN